MEGYARTPGLCGTRTDFVKCSVVELPVLGRSLSPVKKQKW
jgi:hypothetical protein